MEFIKVDNEGKVGVWRIETGDLDENLKLNAGDPYFCSSCLAVHEIQPSLDEDGETRDDFLFVRCNDGEPRLVGAFSKFI